MTDIERLARKVSAASKRLDCARELLSQSRYEYNEVVAMMCEACDERKGRKNG